MCRAFYRSFARLHVRLTLVHETADRDGAVVPAACAEAFDRSFARLTFALLVYETPDRGHVVVTRRVVQSDIAPVPIKRPARSPHTRSRDTGSRPALSCCAATCRRRPTAIVARLHVRLTLVHETPDRGHVVSRPSPRGGRPTAIVARLHVRVTLVRDTGSRPRCRSAPRGGALHRPCRPPPRSPYTRSRDTDPAVAPSRHVQRRSPSWCPPPFATLVHETPDRGHAVALAASAEGVLPSSSPASTFALHSFTRRTGSRPLSVPISPRAVPSL